MTKEQLFKTYSIDERYNQWDNNIDNWMSVEIYRLMHNGELPKQNDLSVKFVTDFLDKLKDMNYTASLMRQRNDFGSLYMTAKRMVYRHSDLLCAVGH